MPMGRYKEHKCKNPSCTNMTTNKSYCCRSCRNTGELKGKSLSEEHKSRIGKAISGENHPMYGRTGELSPWYDKHHTEESKQKISESMLGNTGRLGQPHSEETKNRISESVRKSYERDTPTSVLTEYHRIAYENYEYKCSICGKDHGKLVVHHLDGNHDNNDPDNLCWLCFSCHGKLHGGTGMLDEELTQLAKSSRVVKGYDI